jgi:chemotaxis protein CheX
MNVDFINAFLTAVLNILSTMANMKAEPGKPAVKTDHVAKGDVTGLIGMAGEQTKGTLAVTFTKPVILAITERMLGDKLDTIDDTVTDMVGELTNMVTGGAKKILSEKGYRFDMALPTVISGKDHVVLHISKGPIIVVPFSTDVGDFFVELSFEQ